MKIRNILPIFIITNLLFLHSFSLFSANKVIGVSGWENNDKNSIINRWKPVLEQRGVFKKYGYKYVESLALPGTGRLSMEQDIYAVAKKIEGELNDPNYGDIDAIDLVGHSKGGVAIDNFAKIIANPDTKEYKKLQTIAPTLMEKWKSNPYFIENVVTVSAPMNGTFKNLIKLANSDTLLAKVFKSVAKIGGDKFKFVNPGALDLAKTPVGKFGARLDYYNRLRSGYAHRTHLATRFDYIVPIDSSFKPGRGHNEIIKNSWGHGSGFDPNNPYAVNAIFSALTHNPYDKSDYNTPKIPIMTRLKDFAYEKGIEWINYKIEKWDKKLKSKIIKKIAESKTAKKIFKIASTVFKIRPLINSVPERWLNFSKFGYSKISSLYKRYRDKRLKNIPALFRNDVKQFADSLFNKFTRTYNNITNIVYNKIKRGTEKIANVTDNIINKIKGVAKEVYSSIFDRNTEKVMAKSSQEGIEWTSLDEVDEYVFGEAERK